MIRAILFDLDGTLLDTLDDIREHVNGALRAFSYPEISLARTREIVGDGAQKLIERALPAGATNAEEVYECFRVQFAASRNERTKLFAGERESLDRLRAKGVLLAVVTNKPQDAAEGVLRKFFPAGFFAFIGGDTGAFPCKPDPSLARYCALTLRCAPSECAFVGDGETDAQAAIRAGMFGVSALWGYRTREQLEGAGATRFAADFQELEKILQVV